MHVRYRTIPLQPPDGRSSGLPVAWHTAKVKAHGNIIDEDVCVAIVSAPLYLERLSSNVTSVKETTAPPTRLHLPTVSTAEFGGKDILDQLNVPALFIELLRHMPHVQDLTIDFNDLAPAPARPIALPPLPFRLRRLVLNPLFPGAAHLIRSSIQTLEHLELGSPYDLRLLTVNLVGDLSGLRNLRALRMDTAPDALVLPAYRHLTALAMCGDPDVARGVRHQLTRLTMLYDRFDDAKALVLALALPRFSALRTLEIEIDRGDDFALAGQPGKQALADACRARRICVSVMRTREPGEW